MHIIPGKKDYVLKNGLLLGGLTKRTWKKFGNNFHTKRKTFKTKVQLFKLIFLISKTVLTIIVTAHYWKKNILLINLILKIANG